MALSNPSRGGWAVAVQDPGLVLAPRCRRPVRVHHQGPAPAVDGDQVMEPAQKDAVLKARLAAVGLVGGVVHLAGRGGLVTSAGPLAVLIPEPDRVADGGRDRVAV